MTVVPLAPVLGVQVPTTGVLSFGYQRTATHVHQGVDLHAPIGTPVRACLAGVVEQTATALAPGFSGYGRVVVVRSEREHTPEGLATLWCLYAHLGEVFVTSGQRVTAGQTIATVGDSCFQRADPEKRCNRPHLHFEVSPRAYPQPSEAPRLDPVPLLSTPWVVTRRQANTWGWWLLLAAMLGVGALVRRWR